jgi:hypothetical protein
LLAQIQISSKISAPTVTFYPAKKQIIRESKVVIKGVSWQTFQALLTSEFQRWYPPRDLSVESIPNLKSKILKPPHLSVGSIKNQKSKIKNRLTDVGDPRAWRIA